MKVTFYFQQQKAALKAVIKLIDGMLDEPSPVENTELEVHDYARGYWDGHYMALRNLKGWIEAGAQL